jgi:hypothetical protein
MKDFIQRIEEPHSLGAYNIFMSSFQAIGLMFSQARIFLLLMLLCAGIIVSSVIPLLMFFTVPGFITAIVAIVVMNIEGKDISISSLLKYMNVNLGAKVSAFACLILVPMGLIIGAGTNLYHNLPTQSNPHIDPLAVYLLFAAIFISLLWGNVIINANILSMRKGCRLLSAIVDSIEALIKNPIMMFIECINWFLALFLMYFIIFSGIIVLQQFGGSMGYLFQVASNYLFALIVLDLFLVWYLVNIVIISYQMLSPLPCTNSETDD